MTTLSRPLRAQFVRNLLADLPQIEDRNPKLREMVVAEVRRKLPLALLPIYENKDLRNWLQYGLCHLDNRYGSVDLQEVAPGFKVYRQARVEPVSVPVHIKISAELKAEAWKIVLEWDKEVEARAALAVRVYQQTTKYTTVEKLVAALPELEKYVPQGAEIRRIESLPASNLIAELIQTGWKPDTLKATPAKKVPRNNPMAEIEKAKEKPAPGAKVTRSKDRAKA